MTCDLQQKRIASPDTQIAVICVLCGSVRGRELADERWSGDSDVDLCTIEELEFGSKRQASSKHAQHIASTKENTPFLDCFSVHILWFPRMTCHSVSHSMSASGMLEGSTFLLATRFHR